MTQKKPILIILILGLLHFSFSNFSNEPSTFDRLLFENSELKIESSLGICPQNSSTTKQYVFLKFTNKTEHHLNVHYQIHKYYNGKCTSCQNSESKYELTLTPNQTQTGDCQYTTTKALKIFHSFTTGESNTILTDFQLVDIKIETL